MDMEEYVVASTLFAGLGLLAIQRRKKLRGRSRRKYKVRPIHQNRKEKGFYNSTFIPMKEQDPSQFFKYTRMTTPVFNLFCELLKPKLGKKRNLPDIVSPEERIAVTLHYLSQGSSLQTTAWMFQLGHSTVHKIIKETCEAIWQVLSPKYLKPPETADDWKTIADDYYDKWNFPNCLGAIDGKHINIQAPAGTGSEFFNNKKIVSIIILACADANYKFTLVDIRPFGSQHDDAVFRASKFGCALDTGGLNLPRPALLPNSDKKVPYALVADEAFPLKTCIMRPYPGRRLERSQRIFNYRLSRARRIIENTFGILVARWRILRSTINAKVENVDAIVKAVVCLHNFAQTENGKMYNPRGYVDSGDAEDGEWRNEAHALQSVGRLSANNATRECYQARDTLREYFESPEGEVLWQYNKI